MDFRFPLFFIEIIATKTLCETKVNPFRLQILNVTMENPLQKLTRPPSALSEITIAAHWSLNITIKISFFFGNFAYAGRHWVHCCCNNPFIADIHICTVQCTVRYNICVRKMYCTWYCCTQCCPFWISIHVTHIIMRGLK